MLNTRTPMVSFVYILAQPAPRLDGKVCLLKKPEKNPEPKKAQFLYAQLQEEKHKRFCVKTDSNFKTTNEKFEENLVKSWRAKNRSLKTSKMSFRLKMSLLYKKIISTVLGANAVQNPENHQRRYYLCKPRTYFATNVRFLSVRFILHTFNYLFIQ